MGGEFPLPGDRREPMRRTGLFCVGIAAASIVIGGCSTPSEDQAPRGVGVGAGGAASDSRSNGEFVHDVAVMNMAEIELSRLALDKASSADVKTFARKLIDDHDRARGTLESLAAKHSIGWPARLDGKHSEIADELKTQTGVDFERDYLEAIIEGHQNLAARLESRLDVQSLADWKTAAAARTQTPALPEPQSALGDVPVRPTVSTDELTMTINRWAAETYPVAQKHLDTARMLENAVKKRSTN
jgi:putative membrane protein